MTIQRARELLGTETSNLSDSEFDRRIDIFAEFFLDRILEKIKQDNDKKALQEVENGGMVNI